MHFAAPGRGAENRAFLRGVDARTRARTPTNNLQELAIAIETTLRGTSRLGLALQLVLIIALSAAASRAMTPAQVVAGNVVTKLLFLGRMGLLLLVATVFLHLRGLGWRDMGLRRPLPSRMVVSVVGGLLASAVLVPSVRQLVSHLGGAAADYSAFERLKGNLPEYLYWALPVTLGSAAFGEELLFRGFVRDALQRLLGARSSLASCGAIALQAAAFGLLHLYQGWGGVATAGTMGLVLGVVWLASGRNLWAGIVAHGLLDLSSLTVIFLNGLPTAA